jgi:hypothetical protein
MNLDELAIKYQTDKSSKGHYYTRWYEKYFKEISNKELKILEIGVLNGSSIKMWEEYFQNSKIYGLDINDLKSYNTDRINILQGDQSDKSFLEQLSKQHGPFDIVIDDGSHRSSDMRASFNALFPLVKNDGYYIIEDLCTNYFQFNEANSVNRFTTDLKSLVDSVNGNGKTCYGSKLSALRNGDDYYPKLGTFTYMEDAIEFIHFYRGICFIKKWNEII